jgi:Methyltransferase domain
MLKKIIKKIIKPKYRYSIKKIYGGLLKFLFPILDSILLPITIIAAFFLKSSRKRRFKQLPLTKKVLFKIGVYPIIDHYYEPLFNPKHLKRSLRLDRNLPGIDLNVSTQLEVIGQFNYNAELLKFPIKKTDSKVEFHYDVFYPPGDSEYLYNMIRLFKPRKVVEIGCGYSTLMALNAHRKNTEIDTSYKCEHICIEPYRHDWLEKCDVKVLRSLVENVDKQLFKTLDKNDILFIDSSHIIRPQGDVLF